MAAETLRVERYRSAAEFLERAGARLADTEAEDNVVLGVARAMRQAEPDVAAENYWAAIVADDAVAGCAIRTPPYQLYLTRFPLQALPALVRDVAAFYERLSGVGGPQEAAEAFAETWSEHFAVAHRTRHRMLIHRVDAVTFPERMPAGKLRQIEHNDVPRVRAWTQGFIDDTGIADSSDAMAARLMQSPHLYFWDDGQPRCMVAATRDLPNGVCVNAVYTPPENRGCGYASAAVATMSEQFLQRGKAYCCLFTDMANPTSNSIYARIGYHRLRQDISIDFVEE